MKKSFSRVRVGFLILIGVITLVTGLFLVGQKSQFFSSTFIIHCNFESAEGVKPGTFVVMAGYNVGAVTDIELTDKADSVCITMRISEDVHKFIKADSRAIIKQEGLVGNKFVNLLIGSEQLPAVRPNGYIQGVPPFALGALADNMSAITDTTKRLAGQLNAILENLNAGNGTIGRLLTDPRLYDELLAVTEGTSKGLQIATTQLARLTDMLSTTSGSINLLAAHADSAIGGATRVSGEIETLVRNINAGRGTVGALMTDRSLYDSLRGLVGALNDVANDASNATNQISRGVYALREHWLLGRVFGGPDFSREPPPESSYQKRLKELQRRSQELDRREMELKELEGRLKSDAEKRSGNR